MAALFICFVVIVGAWTVHSAELRSRNDALVSLADLADGTLARFAEPVRSGRMSRDDALAQAAALIGAMGTKGGGVYLVRADGTVLSAPSMGKILPGRWAPLMAGQRSVFAEIDWPQPEGGWRPRRTYAVPMPQWGAVVVAVDFRTVPATAEASLTPDVEMLVFLASIVALFGLAVWVVRPVRGLVAEGERRT
jgi:hypothetical protein